MYTIENLFLGNREVRILERKRRIFLSKQQVKERFKDFLEEKLLNKNKNPIKYLVLIEKKKDHNQIKGVFMSQKETLKNLDLYETTKDWEIEDIISEVENKIPQIEVFNKQYFFFSSKHPILILADKYGITYEQDRLLNETHSSLIYSCKKNKDKGPVTFGGFFTPSLEILLKVGLEFK